MIGYQFAFYLGQEKEGVVFSYLIKENFIAILKTEGEFDKEDGKNFLQMINQQLTGEINYPLERLEEAVNLAIKEVNLPANFSAVFGYLVDHVLYLKTINNGAIYIIRNNQIGKIIDGDNNASGYIKKDDYLVFSFFEFFETVKKNNLLKKVAKKTPHQIVEEWNIFLKDNDDSGLVALIVRFFEQGEEVKDSPRFFVFDKFSWLINKLNSFNPRKKISFLVVSIVSLLLLFNISQGLIKTLSNNQLKKIETKKELILSKLNEAEDTAFFNINRSQELIDEAKNELNYLQKELKERYPQKIEEIKNLISEKEKTILKKEEKQGQEFYDLTIEEKNSQGSRLYLDEESLSILDKRNGRIYILNLEKKSIKTISNSKIKKAELISAYENKVFFFIRDEGIYQVEEEKIKKVVEADKDWKEAIDFWVYAGNLYLLDRGNDQIYKYLAISNGYSQKTSYFKGGEAVDLNRVNSMAIDASVYLGLLDYILKYTSGIRESFKVSFPTENINLTKIYTNKNLEKLLAWDKNKGVVFVFSKKGEYEREIKSPVFNQATDLVVFGQKIYVLLGNKIYMVDL